MFRKFWLECILIVAVVLLVGQLAWPAAARWWKRPGPGQIGTDQFEDATLAPEYLVYIPPQYDSHSWPLVVYLHGSGVRGRDPGVLRNWGPFAATEHGTGLPAIVVAPQCLPLQDWQPEVVVRFIEHLVSTYEVDRNRIYLVGYSMGGYGTWRTAAAHPELFAAIVPVSGGGEPGSAKALVHVPVWAFHGAVDTVVPVSQSKQMTEATRDAGGQPRLTVIPNAGHGVWRDVFLQNDLWKWLFEQQLHDSEKANKATEPTRTTAGSQ